jgi:hypothetical protein
MQQSERGAQREFRARLPASRSLEPEVAAARRVVGVEDVRQRVARIELERRRDLLLLAPHVEEREFTLQACGGVGELEPGLDVPEVLRIELAARRGHGCPDVEAACLVATGDAQVPARARVERALHRGLAAEHRVVRLEARAVAVGIVGFAALSSRSPAVTEAPAPICHSASP